MNKYWVDFLTTKEYTVLTEDQKVFFEKFFTGKNVFITGSAGVGKSFCLKTLFDFCSTKNIQIAKTASTGIAALTIGGSTIHSFAGIGLGDKDANGLIDEIKKNKKARSRITNVKVLFIDEVSMINGSLLDKLDIIFKYFRFDDKPFGGVQMVFSGDFLQLPYVNKGFVNEQNSFAFQARSWRDAKISVVHLQEIKRQDAESDFAKCLNKLRFGDLSMANIISGRTDVKWENLPISPIKLFALNSKVDSFNIQALKNIDGQSFYFYATEFGNERQLQALDRNCLAPKVLELKIGAQVILLSNLDTEDGWVNGTIAKVIGIENNLPIIQRANGDSIIVDKFEWNVKEADIDINGDIKYKVVAGRIQIPLKLGYAISIHKSQSLTMDYVDVDLSGVFEYGQVYVALSRARTLSGLSVQNFNPNLVKAHPDCVAFYRNLSRRQ